MTSTLITRECKNEIDPASAPTVTYFPPLTIDGETIDLAHLEPLSLAFEVQRLGGRTITIDVKFSNHCYTETFASGQHDPNHIVMDQQVKRVFNLQRYELSRQLPDIVRSLPNRSVHITRPGRNYVYVAEVDIAGLVYPLFFHLKRGGKRYDLTMMIESAYPTTERQQILQGTTKVSFAVLCAKTFQGQKVRSHTRR